LYGLLTFVGARDLDDPAIESIANSQGWNFTSKSKDSLSIFASMRFIVRLT